MATDRQINRMCVFCGTNPGTRPEYGAMARKLGQVLAEENIELVYGGASVGIMGELADSVQEHGGHVTGIIPQQLVEKEAAHRGIPNLIVVASMHQRKSQMADMSDGFIALPGGIGTLEGFFELVTWRTTRHSCAPLRHFERCRLLRWAHPISRPRREGRIHHRAPSRHDFGRRSNRASWSSACGRMSRPKGRS